MRHALMGVGIMLIFLLSFGSSCSSGSSGPGNREAYKTASDYWYSGLSKCGDSYYAKRNEKYNNELIQIKDVSVKVLAENLAEADKLNGIEWVGYTFLIHSAHRSYTPPKDTGGYYEVKGGWGEWRRRVY